MKDIEGTDNYTDVAFIRIMLIKYGVTQSKITRKTLAQRYCVGKIDRYLFPLTYQNIEKYQSKDK